MSDAFAIGPPSAVRLSDTGSAPGRKAAPPAVPRFVHRFGGMFDSLSPQGVVNAAPSLQPPRPPPPPAPVQTAAQRLAEVEDAHQRSIDAIAAVLDRGTSDEAASIQQYVPLLVAHLHEDRAERQ